MKHTPAPWKVSRGAQADPFSIESESKTVAHVKMQTYPETTIANANLIAAAPGLLAACKEFVRKVECGEARSRRSYAEMISAIKKAEGD